MTDLAIFLAIIVGVELLRRFVVLRIAKRISTPEQYAAFIRTFYGENP